MLEKQWSKITTEQTQVNGELAVAIHAERSDGKIIAVAVTKSQIGDTGLIKALEILEKHRNCECEVGRYVEHREYRRKKNVSTAKKN